MERKKRGERRRERDRWGSYWVREAGRLKKRDRERRGSKREREVKRVGERERDGGVSW